MKITKNEDGSEVIEGTPEEIAEYKKNLNEKKINKSKRILKG